jgi:ribosome-binding factor A
MSSRRVLKAAQAIREVVSMAIIRELKDPRIRDVTVTMVEVTPDLRQAKVNVTVMGDETKQKLCVRGLQSSAGYLQSKVGKRIDTRYTPRIEFVLDQGLKNALTVTRILEEIIPNERLKYGENDSEDSADQEVAALEQDASAVESSGETIEQAAPSTDD